MQEIYQLAAFSTAQIKAFSFVCTSSIAECLLEALAFSDKKSAFFAGTTIMEGEACMFLALEDDHGGAMQRRVDFGDMCSTSSQHRVSCRTCVAVAGNNYCVVAASTRLSTGFSILSRDVSMVLKLCAPAFSFFAWLHPLTNIYWCRLVLPQSRPFRLLISYLYSCIPDCDWCSMQV